MRQKPLSPYAKSRALTDSAAGDPQDLNPDIATGEAAAARRVLGA